MMFNPVFVFALVLLIVPTFNADEGLITCKTKPYEVPDKWVTMVDTCTNKMRAQVQEELNAAMTYLAMGAHFSQDTVNRPGFAKFFFESASEERQHAIKIMEYLLMRGELLQDLNSLIRNPKPRETTWGSAVQALEAALNLETDVTKLIREIIMECESPSSSTSKDNDYHLVDYLSGDFLTEQYNGQRDLAGKISTLGKMMDNHGPLGEFLFDKKLLNGEL